MMRAPSPAWPVLLFSLTALLGCPGPGGPTDGADGGAGFVPSAATIRITYPFSGSELDIDDTADRKAAIEFEVTDFSLRNPGECGDDSNCGHVHVLIDGEECNDKPDPYNNVAMASPAWAKFGLCATAEAVHNVTLQLHRDDHSVVKSETGKYASDTISVTARKYIPPTFAITSPAEGSTVALEADADKIVPIAFESTNLTLLPAGECGRKTSCGSIELTVDGTACNAPGETANNRGLSSPLNAKLVHCPMAAGEHTVTLTVVKDDQTPLMVNGEPLRAEVNITTIEGPSLQITSPANGGTAELGTDADQSVAIEFVAANFTLTPGPGMCGADEECGFLNLNIDGDDCNDPGAPGPVNNGGATTSPIDAKFAHCTQPLGSHTVTLTVLKDDFTPLTVNGAPMIREVTFTTIEPQPRIAITAPAEGSTVTHEANADKTVPVSFTTKNLTLVPGPGMCGATPRCGFLALQVDSNACNDPGSPGPQNNGGVTSSPIDAKLIHCPAAAGAHVVSVIVIGDDFQPLMNVDGPVGASVNFTAAAPTVLTITSPTQGSTVTMGTDANKSVPIHFELPNIVLKPAPGQCGGAANCGVMNLNIDGNDCNDPGFGGPINNGGATSSPIDARFNFCPTPAGEHTVLLTVSGDNFLPLTGSDGKPMTASITITTQ